MHLKSLNVVRRALTDMAMRGALSAGQRLSEATLRSMTGAISAAANWPLGKRLRTNMELALGQSSDETARRYFQRFGFASADALLIYRHGLAASGISERCTFGASVQNLDAAMARGRGVVLVSPHLFGYEIAAGVINTRHKVVGLARAGKSSKEAVKKRWYEALGLETVVRPRGPLNLFSAWTCLQVVRDGHCLGITPDLVDPHQGIAVEFLGRAVHLMPGAFAVALLTQSPVVNVYGYWKGDYPVLEFTEPKELQPSRGRGRASKDFKQWLREPLQEWCREFEVYLRQFPENWMFWLDKRWTEVLRAR